MGESSREREEGLERERQRQRQRGRERETERQRERERILSRLHVQQQPQCGTQSHDPGIIT